MQTEQYIDFHQQRTFTQVLNSTFAFIKHNFSSLLTYLSIIVGPLLVTAMGILVFLQIEVMRLVLGSGDKSSILSTGIVPIALLCSILLIYFSGFVLYGTVFAYMSLYAERKGRNFDLADVWGRVKSGIPVLLSTTFAITLILLLVGFALAYGSFFMVYFLYTDAWIVVVLLFAVPLLTVGIYCSVLFSLVFTISLRERLSVGDAIIRSFSLVRGNWWQTAGILVFLLLIAILITYIISLPAYFLIGSGQLFLLFTGSVTVISTGFMIASALTTIASYMVYTIPLAGMIIQYYNLVERKEAPGLMERVQNMTEQEPLPDENNSQSVE